jgi:hypothetical protein
MIFFLFTTQIRNYLKIVEILPQKWLGIIFENCDFLFLKISELEKNIFPSLFFL